jgi:hypothetical protein
MRCFARRLCGGLLAILLIALAIPGAGTAGQKPKNVDDNAETRFVLYALEDLLRTTWPTAESVGATRHVRAFVVQRERIVDDLSHRIRDGNLAGKSKKDLIELFELYLKAVRERGETHAAELEKLEEQIKTKWLAVYRKVDAQAAPARLKAASRLTLTAMDYMSNPDADPLAGLFGLAILGLLEESKIQADVLEKARAEFKPILEEAKLEYAEQAALAKAALLADMKKEISEITYKAKALALSIAEARSWKPAETPFVQADSKDGDAKHLFAELARINAMPVTTDRGATREADDRLAKAKKYMEAAKLVPRATDNSFNFYRAVCYGKAGIEANQAAVLAAGANGFATHRKTDASEAAVKAWVLYAANNDRDLTPLVLHNWALALAYNGKAMQAYDVLKKTNNAILPTTAQFYYDTARICSVAAEDFSTQATNALSGPKKGLSPAPQMQARQTLTKMLQDASLALDRAVSLGFNDFERARDTRDLQFFRSQDARTLGRFKTFDKIIGSR